MNDNIKRAGRKEESYTSVDHQFSKGFNLVHFLKFMGIGIVVGVAYIDPGNWGTDIASRLEIRIFVTMGSRYEQFDGDVTSIFILKVGHSDWSKLG